MSIVLPNKFETYKITGMRYIFSPSKGVGVGMKNDPDDVVTVQFMLNAVQLKGRLVLDGICGPKTIGQIRAFQLAFLGSRGAGVNGKIHPINRDWPDITRQTGTTPIMAALNSYYFKADPVGYGNWLPFAIRPVR